MSRIYKILFDNGSGKKEMFAIKPFLERFDDFKEEIFIRMPELKKKSLKFYYEDLDGDKITIFNTNDFAIFQEQCISKVFVEVQTPNGFVNFAPWPTVSGPETFTSNSVAASSKPGPSNLKKFSSSASADDVRRHFHAGVICDNCDKEIRGYRYKCLECADFDLCMECEPSNHSQHLMLRIANPHDSEICYRAKLGKRFGRLRRSESLCSKPTEDRHHDKKGHHDKKSHHKRHATCSRSANFADVVSDILKSAVAGPGVDVQLSEAFETNENPKTATRENQNDENGKKPKTSSTATPLNTPSQGSLLFPPFNNVVKTKLINHIDKLSNMTQHFAAMMDPFAAYIHEVNANIANGTTPAAASQDLNNVHVLSEYVQDVLKTLTTENIDSVFEQLKALKIDTDEKISNFVSIISQKAINEPHLSAEIVKLTRKLTDADGFSAERMISEILEKIRDDLEIYVNDEDSNLSEFLQMKEELSSATDEHRKMELNALIEEEERKLRCCSISLMQFIGELYRQDMISNLDIRAYLNAILGKSDKKVECLCKLLTMIGQKLETRTGDANSYRKNCLDLTKHFRVIETLASHEKLSSRSRSTLLALIELRKNKWIPSSEPMDRVNTAEETEKQAEPQTSKQSDAMIADCTDDENEDAVDLHAVRQTSSDESQSEKSIRGDSPSREWAFVNANEIDDMAQASASAEASTSTQDDSSAAKKTGTLPKQILKQSQNAKPTTDEPSFDYSELSRRLNEHIIGEKTAARIEENVAAARLEALRMGEYLKTSESQVQPVESAPKETASENVTDGGASGPSRDPRIARAVNTMTAMGFSNEGGWLNQLLEAVNGDITSAIELMTPHK